MCYLSGEIFFGDFDVEIDEFVLSLPSSWYSKLAGISLARTAIYWTFKDFGVVSRSGSRCLISEYIYLFAVILMVLLEF